VWLWCVRTGTGLKRRLLVWCERLSCSSESVVVTCIIVRVVEQWRVWPKAWQQMHAQVREQQALLCKRDAAGMAAGWVCCSGGRPGGHSGSQKRWLAATLLWVAKATQRFSALTHHQSTTTAYITNAFFNSSAHYRPVPKRVAPSAILNSYVLCYHP
jgi:hypothetical protein